MKIIRALRSKGTATAFVLSLVAGMALAQSTPPAPESAVPPWAPALVPMLTLAIKLAVEKLIPDSLIVKIRDQYVPFVAVVGGVLIESAQSGQINWTQGALVGLAGIGIHQFLVQSGLRDKVFGPK